MSVAIDRLHLPSRILIGLAAVPLITIALFYGYTAVWRLRIGAWPQYGRPDAGVFKGWEMIPDVALAALIGASALAVGPLALGVAGLSLVRKKWRSSAVLSGLAASLAASLLVWSLLWLDPGGFFNWFFD